MSDHSSCIGIVGGGIAGLTLGCALLKESVPVIIFEKSPEETSYGAAISLSSNALRLLDRLGIYPDLKNQSFVNTNASIQGTKKTITFFKTPEILTTRRQTLMSLLSMKYLSLGGEILYDHELKSFDPDKSEAVFFNSKKYILSHLAGCDGIRSTIRESFFSNLENPRYSGYTAWRGIGRSNLKSIHFALGPRSHVVSYPINNREEVSFVAVKKENYEFKESWREVGLYNDLLDDFSFFNSNIFPDIEKTMPLYKWGIYIRPRIKSMIANNITLLGDAAHPMVPFLGQGACMAIEDAYSFAVLYKKYSHNIQYAQNAYNALRNKRTKRIQWLSMMQGRIYHMKNPVIVGARNAVMKYTNIPGNDLKKIHDYDAHDEINIYLNSKCNSKHV